MIKKLIIYLLFMFLGAGLNSCIKDDMSDCPPPGADSYLVTFIPGNDQPSTTKEVEYNAPIDRPVDPVWAGHDFLGWSLAQDHALLWDFDNGRVTSDLTLYGRWSVIPVYTVTFDSQGGSEVPEQFVARGEFADDPGDPARDGFFFNSWNTQPDGSGVVWDFISSPVTEDVTLYAQWDRPFIVMFSAYGGIPVPATQLVVDGGLVAEPEPMVRDGFTFGGWFVNWDFSGDAWDFNTSTVTENMILYAKWIAQPVFFTVTFDTNGGDPVPEPQTVEKGKNVVRPADPTKEAYAFVGWYSNPELTVGPWIFPSNTVNADMTLYARWLEPARSDGSVGDLHAGTLRSGIRMPSGWSRQENDYQIVPSNGQ